MYRRSGRGRLLLLAFLALSVVIITLDFRDDSGGPLERVKDGAQAVIAPIQRGLTTVTRPIGNFFSSIGELANLREENTRLKDELEQAKSDAEIGQGLAEENAELIENLELDKPWFNMDRVAAQVIADAPGNYKWAVVIDRGTSDGIKPDMAVFNPDGLVGKIIPPVDSDQATVLLLIDPNLGASATDEDRDLRGIASGNGEGEDLSLDFVPKGTDVAVGTRIVTSNYNGNVFPRGMLIGYVSAVGGDVRASQAEIDVRPAVDFQDLNIVQVLLETGGRLASEGDG
ncbi:MAG TPA: rod shape-determining protein MreC [Actinomycetota bacterium]|nr:rod shape-determining protein MreC [Actinomycetota bacterium]